VWGQAQSSGWSSWLIWAFLVVDMLTVIVANGPGVGELKAELRHLSDAFVALTSLAHSQPASPPAHAKPAHDELKVHQAPGSYTAMQKVANRYR
jgi:hypothetical protein